MATIKFLIRKKSDTANIYVRLSVGRKIDIKAPTKYIVNPKDWSVSKGESKSQGNVDLKALNEDLSALRHKLLNHYNDSVKNGLLINTEWLKNFLNPKEVIKDIPNGIVAYFDYYIKHKKTSLSESSIEKYTLIKNMVERFQSHHNTVYLISDVNADFKLKYEKFCKEEKYGHNTTVKSIRFIKTICYHARDENGIATHTQLNKISSKLEKVHKVFLNFDELKIIKNKKLNEPHLLDSQDWLLISCETGQRVSDFMRFKKEWIRYEGSVPLIEFTQQKTGKNMTVPLNAKVMEVLERRGGEFPPEMNDQYYNENIKEVCKLAGLNNIMLGSKIFTDENKKNRKVVGHYPKHELVTSHIGRRSFATNYYGIIPTSLLMYITGHSTEKQFLEYIGKSASEKAIQIADYFNKQR